MMKNISLIYGDIVKAKVDAIVNAANVVMLGGGGVDGAIHRAAGPQLLAECQKVEAVNGIRCPVGEARLTAAGSLNAKYVVHTVGPRYRIDPNPSALLASAYRSSLSLANENNCESIAFPAISCGAYGFPIEEAAHIAFGLCKEPDYSNLNIEFYLYPKSLFEKWSRILKN